jgi:predicted  nucleic acid-binding Zn-ribbon protein
VYDGPTLPGSGVEACDTINVALSKIDSVLVELKNQVATNTSDIASIKEQIININSQITNINNNCCS